jgi:multiple sugar transport system permease protein
LSTLDVSDYPLFLAGSVLASIPALALFGVAQRKFLHQYRGPGWLGR